MNALALNDTSSVSLDVTGLDGNVVNVLKNTSDIFLPFDFEFFNDSKEMKLSYLVNEIASNRAVTDVLNNKHFILDLYFKAVKHDIFIV